jgi:hypothetical protein
MEVLSRRNKATNKLTFLFGLVCSNKYELGQFRFKGKLVIKSGFHDGFVILNLRFSVLCIVDQCLFFLFSLISPLLIYGF